MSRNENSYTLGKVNVEIVGEDGTHIELKASEATIKMLNITEDFLVSGDITIASPFLTEQVCTLEMRQGEMTLFKGDGIKTEKNNSKDVELRRFFQQIKVLEKK